MAQTYPERLPSQIDSDAEQKVFDLLSNLSEEYAVIWHILLNVKRPVNQGGIEDREIDFLVVHPQHGILVLEVKGGGVGFNGKRHQWYTHNRNKEDREIKDPFEQARGCMHELLRRLKSDVPSYFTIGYAAVFPDISEKKAAQLADDSQMPIELILDHSKLEGPLLATSIENVFRYHKRRLDKPLGQEVFDRIIYRYGHSWFVPSLDLSDLSIEKKQLEELTEQQFVLLDALSHHNNAAISGFAGTGKTFLAMEKARRLARDGMHVLLVCYNAKLASALERQIREETKNDPALANIDLDYFHALVKRFCRLSRISPSLNYSDDSYAKALLEAAKRVAKRYDAILADEGQDFKQDWWEALQALLSADESVFYIFYDNRQNIYTGKPYYPIPADKHFPLTHNCRTTRKLHELIMYYYDNLPYDTTQKQLPTFCRGPEGREYEHSEATLEDEQIKLDQLLDRFTRDEGIPIASIVLLTPSKKEKSRFHDGPIANGQYFLSWGSNGESEGNNILSCNTIHSFKGLERDIVILAELDNLMQMPQPIKILYVAVSRARFHIIILGNYYLSPNYDPFLPDFPDE